MRRIWMTGCCWLLLASSAAAVGFPGQLEQYADRDAVLQAFESDRGMLNEMYQSKRKDSELVIDESRAFRLQLLDTEGSDDFTQWFLEQPAFAFPFDDITNTVGVVVYARGESFENFAEQARRQRRSEEFIASQRKQIQANEGKWGLAAISYDIDPGIIKAVESPESLEAFVRKFGITAEVEQAEVFVGTWGAGLFVVAGGEPLVIASPSGILLAYPQEEYAAWLRRCWEAPDTEGEPEKDLTLLGRLREAAQTPYGKGMYIIAAIFLLLLLQRTLTKSKKRKAAKEKEMWYNRYKYGPSTNVRTQWDDSGRARPQERQLSDGVRRAPPEQQPGGQDQKV